MKYTMWEAKRHMENCREGGLQFISQTKVKPLIQKELLEDYQ